jgi:hypothetical protein
MHAVYLKVLQDLDIHASITVKISHVCLSQQTCFQVLTMMNGLEPHVCLFSERIPIENTFAYQHAQEHTLVSNRGNVDQAGTHLASMMHLST